MIVEERTYTMHPARCRSGSPSTASAGADPLGRPIGFFTSEFGTRNQVVPSLGL